MLTGGPRSGKSLAVKEARKLWKTIPGFAIGADNPTKSGLTKDISLSLRTYMNGADSPYVFSSLAVPCEEFGNLITKYDNEFLSFLSHIWDNPPDYQTSRTSVQSFNIDAPNMTILAGVTPDALGSTFPDLAWGQGFTSRVLFIYAERPKIDTTNLFQKRVEPATTELAEQLGKIYNLYGEAVWTPSAMDALVEWSGADMPPVPTHSKLRFYNGSRLAHTIKLSMISAISARRELSVELEDFERARSWLLEAETFMPDVFRAMAQKSDLEVISEMHIHLRRLYDRRTVAQRVPIEDEILWEYLAMRETSERIPRIIEAAERGGWIRRAGMRNGRPIWIPRPLNEVTTKL